MTQRLLSIIALMSLTIGCTNEAAPTYNPDSPDLVDSPEDLEDVDDLATGKGGPSNIQDPTPATPGQLLAMVKVQTWRGMCSGVVIANDRVLTAGHCFCTEDTVGSNECQYGATIAFRPNPATGNAAPPANGTATVHPGYNPSWTDLQIQNDLAVVDLSGVVPSYVIPLDVTTSHIASGTEVMVTGFGSTGSDCSGAAGTLNYATATIDEYEDSVSIMRFNPSRTCPGDSGGAILNLARTKVLGIHSNKVWTPSDGWVSKAMSTHHYRDWIKGLTCSSSFWDRCDGKGPICRCGPMLGDCDNDSDCKPGLHCENDVGANYGYPESADVCLSDPPPAGDCTCGIHVASCVVTNDACSFGFTPTCGQLCGGCTCQ